MHTDETSLEFALPTVEEVPLFPLNAVLYPGGPLSLRIFEPRYLDMISERLRNDGPFGVCLISSGAEAGAAATPHEIGTLARITDWNRLEDGLLGITAVGEQRFRVLGSRVASDQLIIGRVRTLAPEPFVSLPERFSTFADLVRQICEQAAALYTNVPRRYGDASWIGYRLSEVLPIALGRKQSFLEMEDAESRLEQLSVILESMVESTDNAGATADAE